MESSGLEEVEKPKVRRPKSLGKGNSGRFRLRDLSPTVGRLWEVVCYVTFRKSELEDRVRSWTQRFKEALGKALRELELGDFMKSYAKRNC